MTIKELTYSAQQHLQDGGEHAGEVYDDDFGGPLYVDGDEGVKLKPLGDEEKREARKLADAIFRRIQQPT
jgi:hypothetical protein